ncbi:MAG: ATP-binding protein, partial [candidate division KSB1 bacterium]|nr:ATP-binding protein [candidate division KSB1 bacterium]
FELNDFDKLDAVFHEEFGESRYYFFDEIQNIPQWERFVRPLQDRGKKVFITGSNASLLSRELGSRLTGRHLTYELFPFSFAEMLQLTGKNPSVESFAEYCRSGGFPEFLKYKNPEILHQLFRDIITRDIVARYQIREHRLVLELAVYLLTNCGNEFSFNRLKNQFQLGSTNTAISYLSYLEDSYLFFTVPKFDFSYAKQRTHAKKVYSVDPGLTRANTASLSADQGRLLENIVFLQLLRLGNEVFYVKNQFECDFIVKQNHQITGAFQVCHQLTEENLPREQAGLKKAMEATGAKEGIFLTFDQDDEIDGIRILPVWKWCLERK